MRTRISRSGREPKSVLEPWMEELPLRMQSVILAATRGPDTQWCPSMKPITRWIRKVALVDGDPSNDFQQVKYFPQIHEIEDELSYVSVHYLTHLIHALEIIGYKHPDQGKYSIGDLAIERYLDIVSWLHLKPETERELDKRLGDKVHKPRRKTDPGALNGIPLDVHGRPIPTDAQEADPLPYTPEEDQAPLKPTSMGTDVPPWEDDPPVEYTEEGKFVQDDLEVDPRTREPVDSSGY